MVEPKFINVYTVLENEPQKLIVYENTTAENIIITCCQILNIGPVARHLFALRYHNGYEFFSSGNQLSNTGVNDYDFRLRYKLPCFRRLGKIDNHAHNYYFHQVRLDVIENRTPDISYDKNKNELVGLGVTDMYRDMLERDVTRETVESDYKKYIPKEVRKHHSIFVKKPIHNSLSNIIKCNIRDAKYVMNIYLRQFEDLAPNYLLEEFKAILDECGSTRSVIIKVDPYNKEMPGVKFRHEGKSEWYHLCEIEELCFITVADTDTSISRKNGIPVTLTFRNFRTAESFISLLDGYYRFTSKWTFNLCKELSTPSLQKLFALKCHGPIGGEFAYAKLEEKRNCKSGCFILRESETDYNAYYLDVCTEQSAKPTTYKIQKLNDEDFIFSGDSKCYQSIAQLLKALKDPDSTVFLQECLPPSEYDQSPLLLCKPEEATTTTSCFDDSTVTGPPQCIDTKQLQVYKGQKSESWRDMTIMYRGAWQYQKNKKVDVAIKVLKTKNCETNLPDLLELAGKWAFLGPGAVVKLFGITLMAPVSIVTEYFPLGNLDAYLRENKNYMHEVNLVDAATCLANAVWHMEEIGIVHGNIRCYKLLVAAPHTDSSLSVRLSDPGLPSSYKHHDIHWIPIEWQNFKNMDGARRSEAADIWALGTTFWEIFSYGQSPPSIEPYEQQSLFYRSGKRLPKPRDCSADVYNLMLSCWDADPYRRQKPQEVLRDINQKRSEVYNLRRNHVYSVIYGNGFNNDTSHHSGGSSATAELSSLHSLEDYNASNDVTVPFSLRNAANKKSSCSESACLLTYNKDDYADDNDSFTDMSMSSHIEYPTATTSLDSMTSLQPIFQLDGGFEVRFQKPKIGQGFYGEVYKGIMTNSFKKIEPQVVAVKKIKYELTKDPSSREDFEREISIMRRLTHPNIVEIKGVIEDPVICLVMEYITHGPLHCYLNIHREKLDPLKNLLKFACDIAEGMDYLGAMNIVHRDLAARNILVVSDTQVKISDFGLAQVIGSNDYYILKTLRELPLKWYAPESLKYGKFSTRSDVWSYGVTLYEMFSFGEDPCLPKLKNDSELNQVKLWTALVKGERLPCTVSCPQEVYVNIMAPCWVLDSHKRVTFKEVIERIKKLQGCGS